MKNIGKKDKPKNSNHKTNQMKTTITILFCLTLLQINAQNNPAINNWVINTTGATNPSYPNLLTNVQDVCYTNTHVFVSCSCIPGYDIGPWTNNPNTPANQNFVFKIALNPQENTGTKTETPLGHIGVWTNGVSIYNAEDGMSYNNQGIWLRDARYYEGVSFDNCLGHPAQNGEYHHHVSPTCLYDQSDFLHHSPIIGFAFDNFPIYGAYGYANTDGTGGIKRMESSYQLRNITNRETLPDGTILNASEFGPAVNNQYPLGAFLQDYEYVNGLGDLDEYNGRFCITPEYPNGTYAYFVTIDANLSAVFPYTLGPNYYGIAQGSGNIGPQSGHHNIPTNCIPYSATSAIFETEQEKKLITIVDALGRNSAFRKNTPLFYIYEDGAVEKRINVTIY